MDLVAPESRPTRTIVSPYERPVGVVPGGLEDLARITPPTRVCGTEVYIQLMLLLKSISDRPA
jgi:hypothetical protein